MTVKQLIKKLKKMPQEAVVTISNDSTWINGEYIVTSVEIRDCSTVEICTDYKKRIGAEQ